MQSTKANKRRALHYLMDELFQCPPEGISTVFLSHRVGMHPGVVGAILTKAPWATRRRRVRINRNKVETHWALSDAGLVDYARRNAAKLMCEYLMSKDFLVRAPASIAQLSARGVEVSVDRHRLTFRCGSVTAIVHAD